MSLNNPSPLSAFAVYKKQKKNRGKDNVQNASPLKKQRLHINNVKISNNSDAFKQNGFDSVNKKKKKNIQLHRSTITHSDEDEPPLLVPFNINDNNDMQEQHETKKQHKGKNTKKSKTKIQRHETSVNELLSELNKTDPTPDGLQLFKWLIAPISPKAFFEKYWERKTLFLERNQESYYKDILSTQKLDGIFREFPLYYTRNIDVVSYENGVKEIHNEEGRVVAAALYDYYSNGCSIRVLNPQTYDHKIHSLISTLQEYFGTMVGTNVYLTPPGSQGFAPHYDDIEAFIIQLEGRKHWKLYKPTGSDVLARDSSPNLKQEDIGEPFMQATLNAGDLLYFPRGTIHEGRTDIDAHSLHITISVYQHTAYADLLEHAIPAALKRAASEDVEFRKGLPFNYLRRLGSVNQYESPERLAVTNQVGMLMQTLIKYINIDQAADKLGRKFMYDSMPPVLSKREVLYTSKYDGDLMKDGKVLNRVEIGMDTEVRLLRYHCLRLVLEEDGQKIYYNTDNAKVYHGEEEQFLTIDYKLTPGIEKLLNIYPEFIMVEHLPIEDSVAKAQLVSDLWERGLLVTNGPLPCVSEDSEEDEA